MDWGGGDIPALSAVNVRAGSLDLSRTSHFGSAALYERWMTQGDTARGDVLITTEAPLGNIAQVPDDGKYILSQRVILLKPRSDVVDATFLAQQMRGAVFQSLLVDRRSGSTATGIRQSRLLTVPVEVPPQNEQRRIVAKLEALQGRSRRAHEALDALTPLLEKLRQSILAAAFRGDLTKDWRAKHKDVEPASELLKRNRNERRKKWEETELAKMKAKGKATTDDKWKAKYNPPEPVDATGLPELPELWCWASVDELCPFDAPAVYGIIQPGDDVSDGVPYVRPVDMRADGTVDLTSMKRTTPAIASQYSRASLRAGDVVLSIVGTIGKVIVIPPELAGANITQSSARIRPPSWMSNEYLSLALLSPLLVRQFDAVRFGNAVQRLNVEHVRQLGIPIPPLSELPVVTQRVRTALARIPRSSLQQMRVRTAELERAVLAKAFRGELVPQDPDDESAEAMLARVRGTKATNKAGEKSASATSRGGR